MIPLPNIQDVLYFCLNGAQILFNAFLPYAGIIIGIGAFGLIASWIVNTIEDKLDWNDYKEDLGETQTIMKELMGNIPGSMAFERWRLADSISNKSLDPFQFIVPKDMMAGQSYSGWFAQPQYQRDYNQIPWPNPPDVQKENLAAFGYPKSPLIFNPIKNYQRLVRYQNERVKNEQDAAYEAAESSWN